MKLLQAFMFLVFAWFFPTLAFWIITAIVIVCGFILASVILALTGRTEFLEALHWIVQRTPLRRDASAEHIP